MIICYCISKQVCRILKTEGRQIKFIASLINFSLLCIMSSIQRMVLQSLPAMGGVYVSHTPVGMLPLFLSGRYKKLVVDDEGCSLVWRNLIRQASSGNCRAFGVGWIDILVDIHTQTGPVVKKGHDLTMDIHLYVPITRPVAVTAGLVGLCETLHCIHRSI